MGGQNHEEVGMILSGHDSVIAWPCDALARRQGTESRSQTRGSRVDDLSRVGQLPRTHSPPSTSNSSTQAPAQARVAICSPHSFVGNVEWKRSATPLWLTFKRPLRRMGSRDEGKAPSTLTLCRRSPYDAGALLAQSTWSLRNRAPSAKSGEHPCLFEGTGLRHSQVWRQRSRR
jgi:hypothetical protein